MSSQARTVRTDAVIATIHAMAFPVIVQDAADAANGLHLDDAPSFDGLLGVLGEIDAGGEFTLYDCKGVELKVTADGGSEDLTIVMPINNVAGMTGLIECLGRLCRVCSEDIITIGPLCIAWDTQDHNATGWAYSMGPEESGPIESFEELRALLARV